MGVLDGNDLQNIDAKVAVRNANDNEPDLQAILLKTKQQIGWLRAIAERLEGDAGLPAGTIQARATVLTPS